MFVIHHNDPVTTSVPTLSRRHAAGAESARGLLFTVLGEFVRPGGQAVWTSAFIDVLRRLGVEEKTTRQALMRTASAGWLTSERVGRRTVWRLTPAAQRLLVDGAERIYGFTGAAAGWDRRWLIVLARAPETERPTRHLLRTRLSWAGLGTPAPGVWVSPHVDRLGEVEKALAEAGMGNDAQVFAGAQAQFGDLAAMARQAWPLEAIEASYEAFVSRFRARAGRDALVATIELVHAWRRFPWIDPVLPDELLPAPWTGVAAVQLFARLHVRWAAAAQAEWRTLNEVGT
jgi:phenylacetic acid degradation operon negative regulatory protein